MKAPSLIQMGKRAINAGGVLYKKYMYDGLQVINKTGSDIATDKLVAVVGFDTTSGYPKIVLADANTASHRQIYVTAGAIANNARGNVWKGGASSSNLNTNSASAAGDPVYLSETAGGFAHTAPTSQDAAVVPVGWVTTKSATVGEIDWYIFPEEKFSSEAVQGGSFAEVVAATNVITAAENGKTFFLNSSTEFASTLPAPFLGAHYTFIVSAAPSGASYTVVTDSSAQVMVGGQHDAGGAAGDVESTLGATTLTFVDGQSVIGDRADFWSDGTNWYVRAFSNVAAGITFTG